MRFGYDSTSAVPVAAHRATGSTVAIRYLARSSWKVVTRAEYEANKAAGIDLYLVFEDYGRPDLSDYAGGKADAEFALKQAQDILGVPAMHPCITFAYDSDPTGRSQLTDGYYDGCAAVLTHACCGPYGGNEVIAHQANRGFEILFPTYAWSGGRVDPRAQKRGVYQYSNAHTVGGVGVDFDHIYGEDFGQWDRKPLVPPDPNHYQRFDKQYHEVSGRKLSEYDAVVEYDRRRLHPIINRRRLLVLREECHLLAGRVYTIAHQDPLPTPAGFGVQGLPNWTYRSRGWRFQQLLARAQGKLVVKHP